MRDDEDLVRLAESVKQKTEYITSQAPTVDDDEGDLEKRVIDYPDWDPNTTFVISGRLPGPSGWGPGRMFYWDEARWWVTETYGGYVHELKGTQGRWAFRVRKGQYTPPNDEDLPQRARRRQDGKV
jgi:hypothetical protein